MSKIRHITTRVDDTLFDKIEVYCTQKGYSRSDGIRIILTEYFKREKKKEIARERAEIRTMEIETQNEVIDFIENNDEESKKGYY